MTSSTSLISQEVSSGKLSVKISTFAVIPVQTVGVELGALDTVGPLDGRGDGFVVVGMFDGAGLFEVVCFACSKSSAPSN